MAADLLFSDKPALELNSEAAEIAGHLFIFLDYYPKYFNSCTMEGMYFRGIENLYSIFKDSAWLINEFSFCYTGEEDCRAQANQQFSGIVDTEKLKTIYRTISDLRTIQSHPVSAGNPDLTGRCEKWFSEQLGGKQKPGSNEDFIILTRKLHGYAGIVNDECGKFIEAVKKSPDQAEIIERWEDIIVSRYLKKQVLLMDSLRFFLKSEKIKDNPTPEQMLLRYFYFDYSQILDMADHVKNNYNNDSIAEFLETSANNIEAERLKELKDAGIDLGSLDDIPKIAHKYTKSEKELKRKLINYFFENKLEKLIKPHKSTSLNIYDLTENIIKNTEPTMLDVPDTEFSFGFYRFISLTSPCYPLL